MDQEVFKLRINWVEIWGHADGADRIFLT